MFKYVASFVFVSALLLPQHLQGQCWSVPVPLETRIQASETIVMGSLLSQQAYWDAAGHNIYTLNFIRVDAYLKGSGPAEIAVATMGGVVGMQAQVTTPSLTLRYENEYMLFLNQAKADVQSLSLKSHRPDVPQFVPYAATQGALTKQFDQFFDALSEAPQTEAELFDRIYQQTQQDAISPDGQLFEPRVGITKSIWDWEQNFVGGSISNITPNPSRAGTVDENDFVTITGSGFGTESNVFYANANDGGQTLISSGVASDNLSWSNSQVVNKPAGDAGTGTIRVNGINSTITIDWAHTEINSNSVGFPEVTRQGYRLVDINDAGGLTFIYNTAFAANTAATESFERALETWRCTTFVNYDRTTDSTSAIATAADDNVNIVTFDASLPTGVLGRATSRFSGTASASCQQENTFWWLKELDVQFKPDPPANGFTWNFGPGNPTGSQYDFETVALHELGHGHGLGHVIDSGALMHFASSNGTTARTVDSDSEAGANAKLEFSLATPCFVPGNIDGLMVLLDSGNCSLDGAATADLSVQKIVSDTTPDEGDTITYTITVTNNGPDGATNVSLTDNLPNGVTRTGTPASASQGSFNDGTGIWTIGSLANAASATLQLEVTVDAGASSLTQPIINATSGLSLSETDPNSGNDVGSVAITVTGGIDLAVGLTASETNPCGDDVLTYTLTLINVSLETANNVTITLSLPNGVTRTGTPANASQGTYNDGTGVWNIGTLAGEGLVTLTVEVEVDGNAGTLNQPLVASTNQASATQNDSNPGNNSDSASITVAETLSIVRDIADQDGCEGGSAVFTFVVDDANATFQWFKNNQPLGGQTNAGLTLTGLDNGDIATYSCEATNACGSVTSFSAMLTLGGTLAVSISPPYATQGLDPIVLTGSINCTIENAQYDWLNLKTDETAQGMVLSLPFQTASSIWQLTVTDPVSSEFVVATATILAAGNPDFYDYNNDGCNDLFDLYELAADWNETFPADPNDDGFIDVRDLLLIKTSDPLGCEP